MNTNDAQTEARTYTFPSCYLASAIAAVEKANKRAAKIGVDPVTYSHTARLARVYSPAQQAKLQELGTDQPVFPIEPELTEVIDFVVNATVLRAPGGWRFGASVEVLDRDEATGAPLCILTGPRSAECADLREAEPVCEHCNAKRRRNLTYALFNEAGERKVVGSTCLESFLGFTPAKEIGSFGIIAQLSEEFEGFAGGGRRTSAWKLIEIAEVAVAWILTNGYVSKKQEREDVSAGQATSSLINLWFTSQKFREDMKLEITDAHKAMAATVVASWAETQVKVEAQRAANEEVSEWDWKLYLLSRVGYSTERLMGFTVGAVKGTLSYLGRLAEQEALAKLGASEFVGTVGERHTFVMVVERLKTFDSDYGTRLMVSGRVDGTNNKVVYWTSADCAIDFSQAGTFHIVATIKKQEDHPKYGKQTTIQRAKLFVPKPPKAPRAKKAKAVETAPEASPAQGV